VPQGERGFHKATRSGKAHSAIRQAQAKQEWLCHW